MTSATRALWIGTYPHPANGGAEGVWRVGLDVDAVAGTGSFVGGALVAETPSPSFLALDGDTLYAVGETEVGSVSAFAVGADGGLAPRGRPVATGGAYPCHVVVSGDVLVANYGDGVLTAVATAADGSLAAVADDQPGAAVRHQGHAGTGPVADRQEGPHAHFVAPLAHLGSADDGSGDVLVVDLGTDELRRHDPAAADGSAPRVVATFPPGTGPRHLAALPSGHLVVVGELDPALFVLAPVGGPDGARTYDVAARYDVTHAAAPAGGGNYPSHVAVSADGTRVLAAVRGADVLAVHAVEPTPDGGVPGLRHLADSPVGGAWPRHFAVLDAPATPEETLHDLVVVANQNDDPLIERPDAPAGEEPTSNLALLRVRRSDGAAHVLDVLALPAPACVVEA
ncbi:6-phosphogluconolactonase (cycloisomerase 2 family) [Cellulosimicrobium cellulans]|uniref:lactonase family protein n=1 Tax=Cellulosimicrobium cellulans TaxID=1710 RepID=UPI001959F05C|nr:beta-propeller fold lactonase family protein [Cellulosimicrobium cellulans]MBM7821183.1 6-phosphogluconolactonase (cycloisomerase 2 family) [Cellulosimicrobium cellulans]